MLTATDNETSTTTLDAVLAEIRSRLDLPMRQLDQAEDEIERAQRRHPGHASELHHALTLLAPAFPQMSQERVYRGHCRELLDRVAAGADTRPGTAAEVCLALSHVSLAVPLNTAAAGLYHRMWRQAFPGYGPLADAGRGEHYEHLEGQAIDDFEALARRKLAQPWRRLGQAECSGRHHGVQVSCPYAQPDAARGPQRPARKRRPRSTHPAARKSR